MLETYTPAQDRRFRVSDDEYSRARIKAILAGYRHVKKAIPFDFGLSLFGSLSKGKALTKSNFQSADIDLGLFMDQEKILQNCGQFANQNEHFRNLVAPKIKALSSANPGQIVGIQANICQGALDTTFASLKEAITRNLPSEDTPCEINGFKAMLSEERFAYFLAGGLGTHIRRAFFALDIGGGLRDYRRLFIRYLQSLPKEEGLRAWKFLVDDSEFFERLWEIPGAIQQQYPQTLEQVAHYYGVQGLR